MESKPDKALATVDAAELVALTRLFQLDFHEFRRDRAAAIIELKAVLALVRSPFNALATVDAAELVALTRLFQWVFHEFRRDRAAEIIELKAD